MSRKLSDKEISTLLTDVIHNGSKELLNPNGIELRLGDCVRYLSTSEEMKVPPGHFVKVLPGEMVMVNSFETLDFSKETIQRHFPGCMLMAWITPTTTMVREGILQAATKVDAGFRGQLNWGFRNSSYKDLLLQNGESIFKLTLELLEGTEVPDVSYGERDKDKYQDTEGVLVSRRRIFADTPKDKTVSSSFGKIDPKIQLSEAGPPFNYIGSELRQLDGKFELVSADVRALTDKIERETASVLGKLDDLKKWLMEHVDNQFSRKFTAIIGVMITAILTVVAVLKYFQTIEMSAGVTILLFGGAALVALAITLILSNRFK
jgi:deoxycytidine triphosphate deaminase